MKKIIYHCIDICSDLVTDSIDSEDMKMLFKDPKKTIKKLFFKRTDG